MDGTGGEDDEDGQGQGEYDDEMDNNSPGAANARQRMAHVEPDFALAPHEKDPRIYAQLPSWYTRRIAPAGRVTYKSESAYDVLFGA